MHIDVLQIELPKGVDASIDGRAVGDERRFEFNGLKPEEKKVALVAPGKGPPRPVLIRGRQRVKLDLKRLLARPEVVLQRGDPRKLPCAATTYDDTACPPKQYCQPLCIFLHELANRQPLLSETDGRRSSCA